VDTATLGTTVDGVVGIPITPESGKLLTLCAEAATTEDGSTSSRTSFRIGNCAGPLVSDEAL
jgi:hypothetical protein